MQNIVSRRRFIQCGLGSAVSAACISSPFLCAANTMPYPAKFALCNETFPDLSFEKCCELTASLGYTGLEIAPFTLTSDVKTITSSRRAELKKIAQNAGLEIIGLHWLLAGTTGYYMTSPDTAIQQKTADYFIALADFCADLGGKFLICGSPQQRQILPGVSLNQAFDYAAATFQPVVKTLEKHGINLALEPLGTNETNFLVNAAQAVELIKKMGSDNIRLHLDCKAMAFGENESIPEVIRKYKDYLVHFHANDPNWQGPGCGDLNFIPIFKALQEIKYSGWVSVEMFSCPQGREFAAKKCIEYMKSCWSAE